MLRNATHRFVSLMTPKNSAVRFYSNDKNEARLERMFNEHQGTYYTAKDVEFCPNRAKEVMQNNVEGASENSLNDEPFSQAKKSSPTNEDDHMEAYRADCSVSLYSVMQSNVPEPFTTRDKAPSHLNMPGSSSSRDYKYLSGKMQTTHHSRQ